MTHETKNRGVYAGEKWSTEMGFDGGLGARREFLERYGKNPSYEDAIFAMKAARLARAAAEQRTGGSKWYDADRYDAAFMAGFYAAPRRSRRVKAANVA